MYEISGSLILVVDDDPTFRMMMRQFLQDKGYAVCEAANAKESIEVFDRESPKMVLLNAQMPVVDGIDSLDACRRIREIDRDEYSPVLMVTSRDDTEFVNAAFEAGAADYVSKPIPWVLLEHRIKYKLQSSRMAYELQASEERFRQLFDDSPLPYQSMDDHGRIVDANKAWLEMMELEVEDAIGRPFSDFMAEDEWKKFMMLFPSFIKSGTLSNLHLQLNTGLGHTLDIEMNGRVAHDSHGHFKQTHNILQNITQRKVMEDELKRLATTDPLTGLSNRRAFFADADRIRKQSLRYDHPYSAMMLDIDHFKSINDNYGHDIGDDVLKVTAAEMKKQLRDIDLLGRLGGEEFAIVMPETDLTGAIVVAERIRAVIEALAVETEQGQVCFTISIGVTMLSDAEESNNELMKQADELLYRAKQNGRNRIEQSS